MVINRKSEAGLLLEIDHLKQDNVRLLNLLKSTEEVFLIKISSKTLVT